MIYVELRFSFFFFFFTRQRESANLMVTKIDIFLLQTEEAIYFRQMLTFFLLSALHLLYLLSKFAVCTIPIITINLINFLTLYLA